MQTKIALSSLTVILVMAIFSVIATHDVASAQVMPSSMPSWFHYKAMLWANGQISDQDFLSAIQTLVSGQNVTNSNASTGSMQGMSGMNSVKGNAEVDTLLTAIGQTIYCNDIEGMQYNAQAMMSAVTNCNNIQAMSSMTGMGSMPGTMPSGINLMQGIPTSVSSCVNTQYIPGQSSQCTTRPTVFDEIANDMIGMSQLFTFDAYSQGVMNVMAGGPQPSMLATPSALQDLSGVLSSGKLTDGNYVKYFSSPARSEFDITRDLHRHSSNCDSSSFPTVVWEFCDHSGVNLDHGHLSHANLIGADLSGANLNKADFVHANLDFANLTNANMQNADLSTADLNGVQMSGANIPYGTFRSVNMNGGNLTGANLEGTTFAFSTVERTSFNGADLKNGELLQADLRGSDFRGADLTGATFSYSDLTGANFDGVDLKDVDLGSATLTGAHLHCLNNPICN